MQGSQQYTVVHASIATTGPAIVNTHTRRSSVNFRDSTQRIVLVPENRLSKRDTCPLPRKFIFYLIGFKMPEAVYANHHYRPRVAINRIPAGAWDSHMHIVDPTLYPLSQSAMYTPKVHTLDHAIAYETSVNIPNMVLVQPSIYCNDNSCLLNALRKVGPKHARGVVAFDPVSTPFSQLREWHLLGVRGVRINLQSVGKSLRKVRFRRLLLRYADAIRPLNWVLQLYIPLHAMSIVEEIAPRLQVRLCVDHFGHPSLPDQELYMHTRDPYTLAGFQSLVNLLEQRNTFVKLSAPYRISQLPDFSDLEPIAKELLRVAGGNQVVFATDWPHTRFEGSVDSRLWITMVLGWCGGDTALAERLFRGNAEDLWA